MHYFGCQLPSILIEDDDEEEEEGLNRADHIDASALSWEVSMATKTTNMTAAGRSTYP